MLTIDADRSVSCLCISDVAVIAHEMQDEFFGGDMTTKLNPILEMAREILKPSGLKGMHVDEIAAEAAI